MCVCHEVRYPVTSQVATPRVTTSQQGQPLAVNGPGSPCYSFPPPRGAYGLKRPITNALTYRSQELGHVLLEHLVEAVEELAGKVEELAGKVEELAGKVEDARVDPSVQPLRNSLRVTGHVDAEIPPQHKVLAGAARVGGVVVGLERALEARLAEARRPVHIADEARVVEPLWRTAAKLGSPYANGDLPDDDSGRRSRRVLAAMIN